jgi:dihydroxy-acid dehydratase
MKASLVSREVIADSIELVARGHMFDGIVALVACDKTIPGAAMALLRLNVPGVVLYGGSILPGHYKGRDLTVQDVFEAVGANAAGRIDDAELLAVENAACPGAGACGGQFTANTMATVMEMIGLSPMGSAAVPQVDPLKDDVCRRAGEIVVNAVKNDIKPRDIVTRAAIDNAIAAVAATGGSTNSVLHLLAMAREAGVPLEIDDFQTVSERTPLLVDLKPAGRFVTVDVHHAGGWGVIAKRLVDGGYVDGSALTVTGRTFAEEAAEAKETPGQEVIHPLGNPIKKSGGLVILRGSLAPDGSVIKVTGIARKGQRGPARVFECEEQAMEAVTAGRIQAGDVVVIRYEGPRGGPGMREMLGVTSAIVGRRSGRFGGPGHRRPFQRCHPRAHGGPCRSGGGRGRAHRGGPRGRYHRHRHREAHHQPGDSGGRARRPPARMEAAGAALHHGRLRQVRGHGIVGRRGRDYVPRGLIGRAVEYFTCFMLILDFTLPTPSIFASEFTQNSRSSSRSRATTRST